MDLPPMSAPITLLVLAAGRGTRMRSPLPKVMHPLAGRSLIGHVVALAGSGTDHSLVAVLAPDMDAVADEVRRWSPQAGIALQHQALGTGDAVRAALDQLADEGTVIVLFGDSPLISADTIDRLCEERARTGAAVLVMGMAPIDPTGYGRLRFDADGLTLDAIVEHVDADAELRRTALCNSGVMAIDAARLRSLVNAIGPQAANGEFYLTDIVALAKDHGWYCSAIEVPWQEGLGINSQAQLAEANAIFQERRRQALMDAGVMMLAPETVQLAFDTEIAPGAQIEPFVVFGPGAKIGPGAIIRSFSHVEQASVAANAIIGPYARLRPGSEIGAGAHIGNFVETKNAKIAPGAKANHLSYLGDCRIGEKSNIGAGTITCNYDGFSKWQTEIGAGAFIGSNSALVAPVTIGDGVLIGAGSTITADIPQDAIALTRPALDIRERAAPLLRKRLARKKSARDG